MADVVAQVAGDDRLRTLIFSQGVPSAIQLQGCIRSHHEGGPYFCNIKLEDAAEHSIAAAVGPSQAGWSEQALAALQLPPEFRFGMAPSKALDLTKCMQKFEPYSCLLGRAVDVQQAVSKVASSLEAAAAAAATAPMPAPPSAQPDNLQQSSHQPQRFGTQRPGSAPAQAPIPAAPPASNRNAGGFFKPPLPSSGAAGQRPGNGMDDAQAGFTNSSCSRPSGGGQDDPFHAGSSAAPASARWSNAMGKRPAPGTDASQYGGSAGGPGGARNNSGHDGDAAGGDDGSNAGPANYGFMTAKARYNMDLAKKGQMFNSNPPAAPRTGLTRPAKRQATGMGGGGGGAASGGSNGRGFVPPFVSKAMDGPEGENAGLYSEKVMQLLADTNGEIPPEITKLDPKIVEMVCNEIMDSSGSIAWEDIAGQEHAKRLIQEMVVWPILNPQLFKGARQPPRGILLFGPPGTGKTLIGKAIASNIKATFFSISASSLTSKWIGEGEKMVRALFAVAGCLQPSVIFIDEIDSILSARKSEGEHEASRRMKTEMLIQMEGCDPQSAARRVLIIGATNRPEELDEAARRRMPKQLYIPLPCALARKQMIERQLGPNSGVKAQLSAVDMDKVVMRTDGYSGSDMRNLIQEACQGPVRDAVTQHGARLAQLSESDLRPVVIRDFQIAARAQKASVTVEEVKRYEDYDVRHGAKYYTDDHGAGGAGDAAAEEEEDW